MHDTGPSGDEPRGEDGNPLRDGRGERQAARDGRTGSSATGLLDKQPNPPLTGLTPLVTFFAAIIGAFAAFAEISSSFGLLPAIVGLVVCAVLVIIAAVRIPSVEVGVRFWLGLAAAVTAGVVALVLFRPALPVSTPSGTPKRTEVVHQPLTDPGVELSAEPRNDTVVRFSWRIVEPAPEGMSRFLVAMIPNVDPSNPHAEFYAWQEIAEVQVGDGNHTSRDFADRDLGSERVLQVYVVDATCANVLRAGDKGTTHVKMLCDKGGFGEPDSDGFEITVVKK